MKNGVRDTLRTSGNRGVPSGCLMVTKNFLRSYGTPQASHANFQPDRYGGSSWSIIAFFLAFLGNETFFWLLRKDHFHNDLIVALQDFHLLFCKFIKDCKKYSELISCKIPWSKPRENCQHVDEN